MIRRTRIRTILALVTACILTASGAAQAAQTPQNPTAPGKLNPAKVEQVRKELLKQNAERKAAAEAEAAKKNPAPVEPKKSERRSTVNPEPTLTTAQISAMSTAAPAAIAPQDQWQITLSREIFIPGQQDVVTAQLTQGGAPLTGATVRIGWGGQYGTYTTDGSGSITFKYTAPYGPEAVPIEVQTATDFGRPAFLYTVPDGYSALTVTGATDQNDMPLSFSFVALSYYYPDGWGWNLNSGGMGARDVFGSVRPAGLNHIEVSGYQGIYLYENVTLAPGERRTISLSGAGAQLMKVDATLDGVPTPGQVYLHSEAMERESRYTIPLPQQFWVKPGRYSLLFQAKSPDLLLYRSGVDFSLPTPLSLNESAANLATVSISASDGNGLPFTPVYGKMQAGQIGFDLRPTPGYLATVGVPYRVWGYSHQPNDGSGWSYQFFSPPDLPPQVPTAPGTGIQLLLGGHANLLLDGAGDTFMPGDVTFWQGRLLTTAGYEFMPLLWYGRVFGDMVLRDTAGAIVWKTSVSSPNFWTQMPVPPAPGTYMLSVDFPVGPYQGSIHHERPIFVRAQEEPLNLTVWPQAVPTGTITEVTAQVTRNGQPVANQRIDLPGQALWTDASGTVVFPVSRPWSDVIPVVTYDGMGRPYGANVFVLMPEQAGFEVTASEITGAPLRGFWAMALTDNSAYSSWESGFPVGLIAPAGPATVHVVREGMEAYFMNQAVHTAPMTVTRIHLDGRQTVAQNVTATLDGTPMQETWVRFQLAGLNDPNQLHGLFLGSQGQGGTAYVTPGTYRATIRGMQGDTAVIGVVGNLPLTQPGPLKLELWSAQMGRVDFSAPLNGVPQTYFLNLFDGTAELSLYTPGAVLLTAGTYFPGFLQAEISPWHFGLYNFGVAPLNVTPGSYQAQVYDLTPTRVAVEASPDPFMPGDWLQFQSVIEAASGWRYMFALDGNYQLAAPITTKITDAAGSSVHQAMSYWPDLYQWPVPVPASDTYTISMTRDMGPVGLLSAQKTVTQFKPVTIEVTVDQQEVLVGRSNPLKVTVMKDGLPVADAVVRSKAAPGAVEGKTNKHGEATLPVHPTEAGPVLVEVITPAGDAATVTLQAVVR